MISSTSWPMPNSVCSGFAWGNVPADRNHLARSQLAEGAAMGTTPNGNENRTCRLHYMSRMSRNAVAGFTGGFLHRRRETG